jgi:hypothetical protein
VEELLANRADRYFQVFPLFVPLADCHSPVNDTTTSVTIVKQSTLHITDPDQLQRYKGNLVASTKTG